MKITKTDSIVQATFTITEKALNDCEYTCGKAMIDYCLQFAKKESFHCPLEKCGKIEMIIESTIRK
jgi:hypothetical protein